MSDHPYLFCARCGHEGPEARTSNQYVCRSCGFKHFINPIAAVVAIMANASGELLMIRRGTDPGRGKLGLPGGFVDVGETAEEAMRREIREETGLGVESMVYYLSLPNSYPYQGLVTPVLDLFYRVRVETFDGASACQVEVMALEVVNPAYLKLEDVAFASNAEALRRYLGQFHVARTRGT